MVAATQACACSGSPTCAALASTFAFGYAATISAATASRLSCRRDDRTTLAPSPASANAIALPMPRDAPVTSAVLPARPVLNPIASLASHITGPYGTTYRLVG